jgi:uncharacterized damage-inducible protein DinB
LNKTTKDEQIKGIKRERRILEELIEKLTDQQLNSSLLDVGWSIKEIIGHITYWDVQGTEWIKSIVEGKSPDIIWAKENSIKELRQKQAEINSEVLKEIQKKSLEIIKLDFLKSYQMLEITIEKLTDEQMQKNFKFNYSEEPVSTREIVNWRKNHYKSHREQLEKMLSQL